MKRITTFKSFLKETGNKVRPWAEQHQLPVTTVWRAYHGMIIRTTSAKAIFDKLPPKYQTKRMLFSLTYPEGGEL